MTKEQFDLSYNKYQPNKFIKFIYKYFSKNTEKKNMLPNYLIVTYMSSIIVVGILGSAFNASRKFMTIVSLLYVLVFLIFILFLFTAVLLNHLRINKISKQLNISKFEYDQLVNKFYPNE
jgi:hypothetical protein